MKARTDPERLFEASIRLGSYVEHKARDAASRLEFSWTADPEAPSDYLGLQLAFERSQVTGEPLPVSSLHCDTVIYRSEATNHAMRFWHDTLHVTTGLTFSLDDELELGLHHLALAEDDGLRRDSIEWQMLRIDLLGQNYLLGIAKRFPIDQGRFVNDCIELGLDEGILREARLTA